MLCRDLQWAHAQWEYVYSVEGSPQPTIADFRLLPVGQSVIGNDVEYH